MSNAPIVLLLSGVNLNLLGDREPEIYGTATLAEHVATATTTASAHGLTIEHLQSNAESELVDAIHGARRRGAQRYHARNGLGGMPTRVDVLET